VGREGRQVAVGVLGMRFSMRLYSATFRAKQWTAGVLGRGVFKIMNEVRPLCLPARFNCGNSELCSHFHCQLEFLDLDEALALLKLGLQ
jgi:hypothetical protein